MPRRASRTPAPTEAPDPDKLVRAGGGGYRTADGRFEVEQSNGMWFLADQQNADELGLPRVTGPHATLRAVREAIPAARDAPASIRRPPRRKTAAERAKPAKPPRPQTWLDRLSAADRRRAERMVEALRAAGFADAEDVARATLEGRRPRDLARRLLDARLDAALHDAGGKRRERDLVAGVLRAITEPAPATRDLPGWALVETEPDGTPTDRRIELD